MCSLLISARQMFSCEVLVVGDQFLKLVITFQTPEGDGSQGSGRLTSSLGLLGSLHIGMGDE